MGIVAHCCVCNEYIPQPHNKNRRYCSARCYMAMNREKYGYVRKENRAKRRWPPEWVLRWAMALSDDHGAAKWRKLRKGVIISDQLNNPAPSPGASLLPPLREDEAVRGARQSA